MMSLDDALTLFEKRLKERVAARLSVQFLRENKPPLRKFTVNMSVGGIFLESNVLSPEGTPLILHFELPDSRHIHCRARVAWVNDPACLVCKDLPPGMGIQFLDLRPEDMEALREYVKNKLILPIL